MLNVNTIAASAEERVLTGVKVSQALTIDGIRNVVALADRVVPANVSERFERRMAAMPDAGNVVDGVFGFAGKLLEAQRDFVTEVVSIVTPEPAAPAPKATKPAAKKSTAKKSTAKKSTAKKSAKKAA